MTISCSVSQGENVALAVNFRKNVYRIETNTSREFSFWQNEDGIVV